MSDIAWSPDLVYVFGHQRPDSDAIGSALGYAWFLREAGRPEVQAARCGAPGPETEFALERFRAEPPPYLSSVWATFAHAARAVPPLPAEAPLPEAMARMAAGERAIPVVSEGRPVGAITAAAMARAFLQGHPGERRAGEVAEKVPGFTASDRISDQRAAFVRSDADDFAVVDSAGAYVGLAPRHSLLEPPRAQLILVDHNELGQAVPGAEEARILEVLDHHKLGNPYTETPIRFVVEPIGCTCTLVAELARFRGFEPPASVAGMLLSGILSDTLVFRSPTCTDRDRHAAAWLGALAGVDAEDFGRELLAHEPGLAGSPEEILDGDRKLFGIAGLQVSVAQVEVTSLNDLPERREALLAAMEERREKEGLDFVALMVTDVVEARSRLLVVGSKRVTAALPYPRVAEGDLDIGEVVSRKKQLIPTLYDALG